MTELERQQRGLLDLVKNRGTVPDDGYLRQVAGSRELAMVREIALWWRITQIEGQCPFTARLLRRFDLLEAAIADYFSEHATSSFVEELSRDFLCAQRTHADPIVRAVSQFEYGLMEAHAGSAETFQVRWDRHPNSVLMALENGTELPPREFGGIYRMRIARDIPDLVSCIREGVEYASNRVERNVAR
jgi:hypothetical protein